MRFMIEYPVRSEDGGAWQAYLTVIPYRNPFVTAKA